MKYEMIFGDAGLFDGAPDDAEYAGWFCQETRWYMILNGKILFSDGGTWCTSDNPYLSADIAAMRRIIKEPKRWTLEDKKEGRLPEVGSNAEYFANNEHDDTETTSQWRSGDELEILRGQNKNKAFVVFNKRTEQSSNLIIDCMRPIETPAEKAQRLREEWKNNVIEIHHGKRRKMSTSTFLLDDIYDAMLSGELPMPVKG